MTNKNKETMKEVLELRLQNLQQKIAQAATDNEKLIYTEAIEHCLEDFKRVNLRVRKRRFIATMLWLCLVVICILSWELFKSHQHEAGSLMDETQSIGKAVIDNNTQ